MDNSNRWSHLPNNVLNDGQPVTGIRQPDGSFQCQGCTRAFDDNRSNTDRLCGRKPSCPFCWVAVSVVGEDKRGGGKLITTDLVLLHGERPE